MVYHSLYWQTQACPRGLVAGRQLCCVLLPMASYSNNAQPGSMTWVILAVNALHSAGMCISWAGMTFASCHELGQARSMY